MAAAFSVSLEMGSAPSNLDPRKVGEQRWLPSAWLVPRKSKLGLPDHDATYTSLPLLFREILCLPGGQSLTWYTDTGIVSLGPLGFPMTAGNFVPAKKTFCCYVSR